MAHHHLITEEVQILIFGIHQMSPIWKVFLKMQLHLIKISVPGALQMSPLCAPCLRGQLPLIKTYAHGIHQA